MGPHAVREGDPASWAGRPRRGTAGWLLAALVAALVVLNLGRCWAVGLGAVERHDLVGSSAVVARLVVPWCVTVDVRGSWLGTVVDVSPTEGDNIYYVGQTLTVTTD